MARCGVIKKNKKFKTVDIHTAVEMLIEGKVIYREGFQKIFCTKEGAEYNCDGEIFKNPYDAISKLVG